jgi:DNA processing protein
MLHDIFHSISITTERKAKIQSAFLHETYADFRERVARMDIEILLHCDATFPKELHDIPNTPFLIYVQGNLETAGIKIAMVGSRESTPYGEQIVKTFVPKLVQAGISIVSGGALGIDALAHESAI